MGGDKTRWGDKTIPRGAAGRKTSNFKSGGDQTIVLSPPPAGEGGEHRAGRQLLLAWDSSRGPRQPSCQACRRRRSRSRLALSGNTFVNRLYFPLMSALDSKCVKKSRPLPLGAILFATCVTSESSSDDHDDSRYPAFRSLFKNPFSRLLRSVCPYFARSFAEMSTPCRSKIKWAGGSAS